MREHFPALKTPTDFESIFEPHPLYQEIRSELNARPTQALKDGSRVRRLTLMPRESGALMDTAFVKFLDWAAEGLFLTNSARQISVALGGRTITCELHNEFITLTWIAPIDDMECLYEGGPFECFRELQVISAARIDVTETVGISESARALFTAESLCYSHIYDGQAELATDFRPASEGFVRYEVAAGKCGELRRGVIVRRLLEIETYSHMLLLGLPSARKVSREVTELETALGLIMSGARDADRIDDHRKALEGLFKLSASLNEIIERSNFRFGASKAYAEILENRLERLLEVSIGEFTTMRRYINNRVEPAVATLASVQARYRDLANRIQRSTELVNTHINLKIQIQNREILDAISQTSSRQYALQQTVEGLSAVAISYYAVSLLAYLLEEFVHFVDVRKSILMLVLVPAVFTVTIWQGRLRNRQRPQCPTKKDPGLENAGRVA